MGLCNCNLLQKGTYIRTLCDDIGKKIGSYAYMGDLKRTYSGGFSIEQSYCVDELEKIADMSDEDAIKYFDSIMKQTTEE